MKLQIPLQIQTISLWQPWASLWALGIKRYETRHWRFRNPGPCLIHAAKKWDSETRDYCFMEPFASALAPHFPNIDSMPRGCLVGFGNLITCTAAEVLIPTLEELEFAFGNFDEGRFGWDLENRFHFKQPIPLRGQQNFWNVSRELVKPELERHDLGW